MKRSIYSVVAILSIAMAVSCQKEESQTSEGVIFTASIEDGDTKTALSGNDVVWSNSDEVAINGITYVATSSSSTSTNFSKKLNTDPDPTSPYVAYYPASIYNGGIPTLPAVQNYESGKISNIPMYASSTTTSLQFKNICAVLAVKVVSGTVNNIRVISDGQPLSGVFSVNSSNIAEIGYPCSNQVVMECGAVVADNTVFYIAIPAGTYGHLQIVINEGASEQTMTTTKAGGVTLDRNTIYPITFNAGTTPKYHAWVQFASDGLKWATMNLGATKERGEYKTSKGSVYKFGALTPTGAEFAYPASPFTGDLDISGHLFNADGTINDESGQYGDAAKYQWGGSWRIPTKAEAEVVFGATAETGYKKISDGTVVTSPGSDYSGIIPGIYVYLPKGIASPTYDPTIDPHIFMPYSGYNGFELDLFSNGHYWTSLRPSDGKAYRIHLSGSSGKGHIDQWTYKDFLFTIRPVMN